MGKQVVQRTLITDDVDGTELPEDTQPVELVHEGKTYSLFLSDRNRKALLEVLDKYTANVEPVPASVAKPRKAKKRVRRSSAEVEQERQAAAAKQKQRVDIRTFATKKFPDYKFPERAAIRREVLDAFYDANPSATRHYN